MKKIKIFSFKNVTRASFLTVLVTLILSSIIPVSAADLTNRTIIIGDSQAGVSTTHRYQFFNPTAGLLGSVRFEYCANSPLFNVACIPPVGLNVSGAGIALQTGTTGFAVSGLTTNSTAILTRLPSAILPVNSTFVLSNIINPTSADTTFYVRISTYTTDDATGSATDQGAVAFSTSGGLSIGVFVPPYLTFCVGVTVGPSCSSSTGSLVDFGELSEFSTSTVTTQFAAATNDGLGLQVFLNGQTMTSGNNVIPALATQSNSIVGSSQFGLNLVSNSVPSVGANRTGSGTTFPNIGYSTSNQYRFVDGNLVARSTLPTDFNTFTVSYIVNVAEDQKPGFYASTLIYTAVASF